MTTLTITLKKKKKKQNKPVETHKDFISTCIKKMFKVFPFTFQNYRVQRHPLPWHISNKVLKGVLASRCLEAAVSYFSQKFTKLINKHFQSILRFKKTFITRETNSWQKYISKNRYQKHKLHLHSQYARPPPHSSKLGVRRGESKNLGKYLGWWRRGVGGDG